ncbi:MAG TPA: hypothetical protein VMN60_08555 [Longimicrobiales bacterium]|nr:hypothetical protein [Longimicrobiales bacterium]
MKRPHDRAAASVGDGPDGSPEFDMTPTSIGRGCLKLALVLLVISVVAFIILMIIEAYAGG